MEEYIDLSDIIGYIEELENEETKEAFYEEIEELKDKVEDIRKRVERELEYEELIRLHRRRGVDVMDEIS